MARIALNVQQIDRSAGIVPSYAALQATGSGGNSFANDGRTFVHIKNGGASPITATFATPAQVGGLDVADLTVTVANGSEKIIGPFEPGMFNQADYSVSLDCSAVTSVTAAVLRL